MRQLAVLAILAAAPAAAEPVTGAAAEAMLFGLRGQTIALSAGLSEQEQAILRMVIDLSESRMRQPLYWYSAIAYSPSTGLTTEPGPVAAANHHGVAAADGAALAACNAAKARGAAPCVIGARVLPRGYVARPLELSFGATSAFRDRYRRARGEKAMAISPGSGRFAIATGAGAEAAALAECNALSQGAGDCMVAIRN